MSPEDLRDRTVRARLTRAEFDAVVAEARRARLPLSKWIRRQLLRGVAKR